MNLSKNSHISMCSIDLFSFLWKGRQVIAVKWEDRDMESRSSSSICIDNCCYSKSEVQRWQELLSLFPEEEKIIVGAYTNNSKVLLAEDALTEEENEELLLACKKMAEQVSVIKEEKTKGDSAISG